MNPGTRTAGGPFPGQPIGYDIAPEAQKSAGYWAPKCFFAESSPTFLPIAMPTSVELR